MSGNTICHGTGGDKSCGVNPGFEVKELERNGGNRVCPKGNQCPFQQARTEDIVQALLVGRDNNQHVIVSKS